MGGAAFARAGVDGSPPLKVPRLAPSMYIQLRDKYKAVLLTLFAKVVCPAEAPEKADHGDIDYIVCSPLTEEGWTLKKIAESLDAVRFEDTSQVKSFAVCLPFHRGDEATEEAEPEFAQIDIEIVTSEEQLHWQAFKNSYGDMWSIIGTMIRPYGLTADPNGLQLRMEELESGGFGKRAARIFLTSDINLTLRFVGLDSNKYADGFHSEVEMFQWLASSFLFRPSSYGRVPHENKSSEDRQRQKKRPMFRRFGDTVLNNTNFINEPSGQGQPTRESILQRALDTFGVREIYDNKLEEARRYRRELALKERLVENLSESFSKKEVKLIMRAWARRTAPDHASQNNANESMASSSNSLRNMDESTVLGWVAADAVAMLQEEKKLVKKRRSDTQVVAVSDLQPSGKPMDLSGSPEDYSRVMSGC